MQQEQLVQAITKLVVEQLGNTCKETVCEERIPIGISARHVHLTQEHVDELFGKGYQLTKKKELMGGLLWWKTKNIYLVCVGEIIGTGLLGALASYPLMKWFYGLDAQNPLYYIPFYTPSAVVGGIMGVMTILLLKRARVLDRFLAELER